jgi:hypothetical protein
MELTYELAHQHFEYDPEDGELRRKISQSNNVKVGDPVGSFNHGYIRFGFDGQQYYVHRVIWLMHYGEWPSEFIDHIDGNRANNLISNLRDVTRQQNNANNGGWSYGSTEHPNVSYREGRAKPYCVRYYSHKELVHSSYHATLDEAVAVSKEFAPTVGNFRR